MRGIRIAKTQNLTIPAGSLGSIRDWSVAWIAGPHRSGEPQFFITTRPSSNAYSIDQAPSSPPRRRSRCEYIASRSTQVENEVALQVRQDYIEILVGRLEMQAVGLQVSAAEQSLKKHRWRFNGKPA